METSEQRGLRSQLAALRRFLPGAAVRERCELCSQELADAHHHLLEAAARRVLCVCGPCAILFTSGRGRYRRVPATVRLLTGFTLPDEEWERLGVPIELAFFVRRDGGSAAAYYPSPAGATESLLPLVAWGDLSARNPVLHELEPEVEALLVNRLGGAREYYRVGIDECFRLVGAIRSRWRGFSGGAEAWKEVARFFRELKARSEPRGGQLA